MLPTGTFPRLTVGPVVGGLFNLWLEGQTGQRYIIEASDDLAVWTPVLTNNLATSPLVLPPLLATNSACRFYRAVWAP